MLTIYTQMRGEAECVTGFVINAEAAKEVLAHIAARWEATKKGRTATCDGHMIALRYSDKKMAGMVWADGVPVPAQEPDAQPRRAKGGVA